jgi:hypothetical protein
MFFSCFVWLYCETKLHQILKWTPRISAVVYPQFFAILYSINFDLHLLNSAKLCQARFSFTFPVPQKENCLQAESWFSLARLLFFMSLLWGPCYNIRTELFLVVFSERVILEPLAHSLGESRYPSLSSIFIQVFLYVFFLFHSPIDKCFS